jgi:hypothetical protein
LVAGLPDVADCSDMIDWPPLFIGSSPGGTLSEIEGFGLR